MLFFIDSIKACWLLEQGRVSMKGGHNITLRRWSPREKMVVPKGLPFHFVAYNYLRYLMKQWRSITEIDCHSLKLVNISNDQKESIVKSKCGITRAIRGE